MEKEIVYGENEGRASYEGIKLGNNFKEYLITRVKEKLYDLEGTRSLIEKFESVASTDFEKQQLVEIFSVTSNIEKWKIGEALAECYLEDFEKARFYYPPSRDTRSPKANLQGADLVGFIELANNFLTFLFGEVKTSEDKNSPPQVMYGSSGMTDQLSNIKNNPTVQKTLIKWLGVKVQNLPKDNPFKRDYERALKVYLQEISEDKYFLAGVLVRDTEPKETDLRTRYKSLKTGINQELRLKLIALYIPIPIKDLEKYITEYQGENNERD